MADKEPARKVEKKFKKPRVDKPSVNQEKRQSKPATNLKTSLSSAKGKEKAGDNVNPVIHHLEPSPLPSSFKIIAGSYEKLLYGLDGTITATNAGYGFHLKPIFIFPAHVSCIKAVAASPNGGKWLATGSADEIIKVWDLGRRKEIGGLMHHEGSITYLQFPSRSHLLSASEDGTLCVFHARDWAVLRSLKGHKGRVNSVAIHPSGKVALSVGQDKTLRMWDLMRGKGSASVKLGKEGEVVRWSMTGSNFVVQSHSSIEVFSTSMALQHTITHPSRIQSVRFCKRVIGEGELLLVAAEDKKVSIYEVPKDPEQPPKIVAEMIGHSNRVKAVETLDVALPPSSIGTTEGRNMTTIVCTISSDGKIFLYDLAELLENSQDKPQLRPVAEYDTKGTRLTCLTIAEGRPAGEPEPVNGKRKRDGGNESENEEDIWKSQVSDAEAEVVEGDSGDEL